MSVTSLVKWVNQPIDHLAELPYREDWVTSTYNRRLICLNAFHSWMVGKGEITSIPLTEVSHKRKKGKKKIPRREQLTENEILTLLNAIRNDIYCPASAPVKHS
jgi:integrase